MTTQISKIEENTDSIMDTIAGYISQGRTIGTFRWLKSHQLLGHVQCESKHELSKITKAFIKSNIELLKDYHIV